jgi:hypothetical protein
VGGLLQFNVAGAQMSVSVNGHVFGQVSDSVVLGAGTVGVIGSEGAGINNFSAVAGLVTIPQAAAASPKPAPPAASPTPPRGRNM